MSIDWKSVERVLVIRLRSIGDTVLATPSITALRRFLPASEIDILVEDWVAPVLDGFEDLNVIAVGSSATSRLRTASFLRSREYDVVYNLHGGTTSSMLVKATAAQYRVGFSHYRYKGFYNELFETARELWGRDDLHSVEQQLALIGLSGVPVDPQLRTRLAVTRTANGAIEDRFGRAWLDKKVIALIHPAAATATKQWPAANFAKIAEHLAALGLEVVAIAARNERSTLDELVAASSVPIHTIDDASLPEITALAARSRIFVGNDSGIAHIAAAVDAPQVVIFGSSNRVHWRPWTDAPHEVVFAPFPCQPCPGDRCRQFGHPHCILDIPVPAVTDAINRVLTSPKNLT